MQEENIKKREWVKSAAIIFLSILLILTFFSNTIMNLSLPEVATVMASSEKINNQVRIQGTVSAKESYDVVADQSRTIESVMVRVGDEVNVGDLLIKLSKGDSDEIQSLQKQLKSLQISYQQKLLNMTDTDYTKAEKEIAKAKLEADNAMADVLKLSAVSDNSLSSAKLAVTEAETAVEKAQDRVEAAALGIQNTTEAQSSGSVSSSYYQRVSEAQTALTNADNNLKAAHLVYDAKYNELCNSAKNKVISDVAIKLSKSESEVTDADCQPYIAYYIQLEYENSSDAEQRKAYEEIKAANENYVAASNELSSAQASLSQAQSEVSYVPGKTYNGKTRAYYESEYAAAQTELQKAQASYSEKNKAYENLVSQKSLYEEALSKYENLQENYDTLVDSLDTRKKSDSISVQLEQLEIDDIQNQIDDTKQQIYKLSSSGSSDIYAKVSGKVQSVNVSAGNKTYADEVLMNIEVGDVGFSMTATVTLEQAKLLKEGDAASVSNWWYGTESIATIETIKPNPQNPRTEKIITFDVTGDGVYAGMSMSFSIGGKSQYYDTVIPLSALRSDANGQFVYVVTVKNSPLGNRYTAKRTEIKVLAQDDTNAAVSGLSYGDYVITTSGKPIESGSLVKLVDE